MILGGLALFNQFEQEKFLSKPRCTDLKSRLSAISLLLPSNLEYQQSPAIIEREGAPVWVRARTPPPEVRIRRHKTSSP